VFSATFGKRTAINSSRCVNRRTAGRGQLWGTTPTDPATFVGVTALLLAVSIAAWSIPARKAVRLEPTEALRTD
jgi:hypothetical protein